jgi:hypothetical protein
VVLLGYLRTIFKDYYQKHLKPSVSVLLTKPKDLDYELFIFRKYEGLMRHLLAKKEARTGTTLEEDLALLSGKEELGYMHRMAIVYRSEKKKILYTNIDLCEFVIRIIKELIDRQVRGEGITIKEFHSLCKDRTTIEKKSVFKRWVHNPDYIFSEED